MIALNTIKTLDIPLCKLEVQCLYAGNLNQLALESSTTSLQNIQILAATDNNIWYCVVIVINTNAGTELISSASP